MSKRVLSLPSHPSSSSSSASAPQSNRRRFRFQLLHNLLAALLAELCSFLFVYEVIAVLRSTCRVLHDRVTADCLLQSHVSVTSRSLPALAASTAGSRAVVHRVPSLSIIYHFNQHDTRSESAMLQLQELSQPLHASRFLFSSVSSLYVGIDRDDKDYDQHTYRCVLYLQSCLLSLLQLLAVHADSLSSLRRLHLEQRMKGGVVAASFLPLTRLQGLTHFRLDLRSVSAISYSSLMSALSSLPSLTSLCIGHSFEDWSLVLPSLCTDAATPLLLRLQSLSLQRHSFNDGSRDVNEDDDAVAKQHDAFLCRLSSLPSPPALQRFSAMHVSLRGAGLLSLFSLPHLTELWLTGGYLPPIELSVVASGSAMFAAPLVSLALPWVASEVDNDEKGAQHELARCRGAQLILPRFAALRSLGSHSVVTGAGLATLYRLTVQKLRFPATAALSFPLLTELCLEQPKLTAATLEQLLSACPQLLRLKCEVKSWDVVLLAARHCARLMQLTARISVPQHISDAEASGPQSIARPFLPQLLALQLVSHRTSPHSPGQLSVLRHFARPPHPRLQFVRVISPELTAQHVLSLSSLPHLCHLEACKHFHTGGELAEVTEARAWTREQLERPAAAQPGRKGSKALTPRARKERCEAGVTQMQPLGPHQQQEMRQRVMDDVAARGSEDNVLASAEGASGKATRGLFFSLLRSMLKAAAERRVFEKK